MRYCTAFVFIYLIQLLPGAHGATNVPVGTACTAGTDTCIAGATCQTTCKLNVGETCLKTDNPTKCVDHATCQTVTGGDKCTCDNGYSGTSTCIIDGALGGACLANSACTTNATDACDATASKCRRMIGQTCTAGSTTECVSTAATCPTGTGSVCTCPTGQTVSTDKKTCKLNVGVTCTKADNPTKCVDHATCQTVTGGDKCTCDTGYSGTTTCIIDGALGGACLANSACTTTATDTCDATASKCRRKIGQACTAASTDQCVSTALSPCPTSAKCECPTGKAPNSDNTKCLLNVGQTCPANSTAECLENSKTCPSDTLKCTCKDGYTASADNTKCSGASLCVTGSMFLMLVTLLISRLT